MVHNHKKCHVLNYSGILTDINLNLFDTLGEKKITFCETCLQVTYMYVYVANISDISEITLPVPFENKFGHQMPTTSVLLEEYVPYAKQ